MRMEIENKQTLKSSELDVFFLNLTSLKGNKTSKDLRKNYHIFEQPSQFRPLNMIEQKRLPPLQFSNVIYKKQEHYFSLQNGWK